MLRTSIWSGTAHECSFPTLDRDLVADVVVIGGGITGLTTALSLKRNGRKVVVVDALQVGMSNTGDSTGNLYAVVDKHLHMLEKTWNRQVMFDVVTSRREAINAIESTIAEFNLDCKFERCPWVLYTGSDNPLMKEIIEKEYDAVRSAGLAASLTTDLPVPRPVISAVTVENQAQFNPTNYVRGLAQALQSENCLIFENSNVKDINSSVGEVICDKAKIKAEYIVLATHTPKGFNVLQAEMKVCRLYGVAGRAETGALPPGIFWEIGGLAPRSLRSYKARGEDYVMVIGEKHKTGEYEDTQVHYDNLENYLKANFQVKEIEYRWSGQHFITADSLPYIGSSIGSERVFVATGFSTDGLVFGTLAGQIIGDLIVGKPNRWEELYSSKRFTPMKSARQFVELNVHVMKSYFEDYVLNRHVESLAKLQNDEGALVEVNGKKLAAYRNERGELKVVSPICPHMKCQVHWNKGERSWDCPCHGSRFDVNGHVIEGPALSGLEPANLQDRGSSFLH